MPSPDPLTPVRRDRFQDYCRSKGWELTGGRWNTTSIAEAIGKPVSKASDLLNGHGAFGSKIARDIEDQLGLPGGYLDNFSESMLWPFELVDRARYEALSDIAKGAVQTRMMDEIEAQEKKAVRGNGSTG